MIIKVGIIGGAGYTAGELLRLLVHHPSVQIAFVHSKSNAGALLSDIHSDLVGETYMTFSDKMPFDETDVLFLCVGHGEAKGFVEGNTFPKSLKIIDLSQDFRVGVENWVYGLPELNRSLIQKANFVANPGCFATAIQLGLLPLVANNLLNNDVHIHAITGSTGAGQRPSTTSHFSWRNNNISIYESFKHRHLKEIKQTVLQLQPNFVSELNFLPIRGNFTRGIYASMYLKLSLCDADVKQLYADFYKEEPFTHVTDTNPNLKQVVGTNRGLIYVSKHDDKVLIISMIDNLLKGASGQAVQNMNLMFGLPETEGLKLKAVAF
jgi:N-acetyl-gamma-glutamyl-phosphate reductase